MNESLKVQRHHLERGAYLYIRQSSMRQVIENVESTKRQYALRARATALGWSDDRIIVIDSDQGESGASAAWREGFQRLVSDVGMGRAGIVMGLEVSRLARNNADWHRLLEICALADTLILDEDGVYDPTHFNDRLLLGLNRPDSYCTSCSTFRGSGLALTILTGCLPVRGASRNTVSSTDVPDMLRREAAAERRLPPGGVQPGGDSRVRMLMRECMDPLNRFRWRFQGPCAWNGP